MLIAIGVMGGQAGIASAAFSAAKTEACKKCPCESKKASCCVEKSTPQSIPESPAIPHAQNRLIQPATIVSFEADYSATSKNASACFAHRIDFSSRSFSVPLFLRHRAILI